MRRVSVSEFGRIDRASLPARSLRLLQAAEEARARRDLPTAFDWSRARELRARSYVGVVQVQGLSLEILPKLSLSPGDEFASAQEAALAQGNLLYMLTVAKRVRGCERAFARQAAPRSPLLEVLIRAFAEQLLAELRLGLDHHYAHRHENGSVVRGRLLVSEHLRRNCAAPHRLYQEVSSFEPDTPLNQVLKAACLELLHVTTSAWTGRCLREALSHFVEVSAPAVLSFGPLHRGNARFAGSFEFARLVLEQRSPGLQMGEHAALSLLFPMDKVFEGMVAGLLQAGAGARGLPAGEVVAQARGQSHKLLRAEDGQEFFTLRPDVLIGAGPSPRTILDTKWKRLLPMREQTTGGVTASDVYQVLAYADRYQCPDIVLLFPAAPAVVRREYRSANGTVVRVEVIDLARDLYRSRVALRDELCAIARL